MTDKEKLVALLTEFGVGFKEIDIDDQDCVIAGATQVTKTAVVCEEGKPKIKGYFDFHTSFEFDRQGGFICMGAWE